MPLGRGATAATSALLAVSAATAIGIGYIHRTQRLEREVSIVQKCDIIARNCVQLKRGARAVCSYARIAAWLQNLHKGVLRDDVLYATKKRQHEERLRQQASQQEG